MKRSFLALLCLILSLALLSACSGSADVSPSQDPSASPSASQSSEPSQTPSESPSAAPSEEPSESPSAAPEPTISPSLEPTQTPNPSEEPSDTLKPFPDPEPTSEPTSTPKPTPAPTPEPTSAPAGGVDLAAFAEDVTGSYEFGFLELADAELLDGFYPGMTGIDTEQCLVYICMLSMNNGEFGLVQVKDGGDVDAVEAVFQARIDYMVGDGNGPGGAWYPGPTELWTNYSRIVSNGNYVMMVVHESCDDIVSEFNALF